MKTVKRIFFFENEEEAKKVRDETGDRYILASMPHYELIDGAIVYSCGGVADFAVDIVVRPPVKGAATGYGSVYETAK